MKRIFMLLIILFFGYSLVACTREEHEIVIKGSFYSLQEAYDTALLTVGDLQIIAYNLNDGSMTLYSESLNAKSEKAIKETRASNLCSQTSASNATADDVAIIAYFGTYAGSVAVMIVDSFTEYGQATWKETVEGIDFHYADGNKILIWREDAKEKK